MRLAVFMPWEEQTMSLQNMSAYRSGRNAVSMFLVLIGSAIVFFGTATQPVLAQNVVAPTCPQGYILSGRNCVKSAPAPSCPTGYKFSGGKCVLSSAQQSSGGATVNIGPWAFITRKVFGVKSAKELDGATYCAVDGSAAADAAKTYFKDNDLASTLVSVDSDRAALEKYQKNGCDILVVEIKAAKSTANNLKPAGSHKVLPEEIGEPVASSQPATTPVAPAPPQVQAAPKPPRATPKPRPKARKKRCSGITYAFTRGNTCACSGGRVFTGSACVRRR